MYVKTKNVRSVLEICDKTGKLLLEKGADFYYSGKINEYNNKLGQQQELAVGCKYLHRGYYCPSPIREFVIVNAKRGRLLKHPTSRSKITHFYHYGTDGRLVIAESVVPSGMKREYLVYEDDHIYGLAFDLYGGLVGVSQETYANGKLQSYFCASCYNSFQDKIFLDITESFYEEYTYVDDKLDEVAFYMHLVPLAEYPPEMADEDILIHSHIYQVHWDNGRIIGVIAK